MLKAKEARQSKSAVQQNAITANKIKLAIVGSRKITDYQILWKFGLGALEMVGISQCDIGRVVSGGAIGVDSFAERFTEDLMLDEPIIHEPNWKRYGKQAGFIRNQFIIDDCDAAIVIWDGISNGTLDSLAKLQQADKPFVLINVTLIPQESEKPIYQVARSIEFHGDWKALYEDKVHPKRNNRRCRTSG